MKRFTLETLGYIAFTFGLILVISSQFKGCQTPDPVPATEQRLPVEQNFKLWTEDDFKQAEAPDEIVNYYDVCQTACPDDITEEDITLIEQYHRTQMQKLIAGGK